MELDELLIGQLFNASKAEACLVDDDLHRTAPAASDVADHAEMGLPV